MTGKIKTQKNYFSRTRGASRLNRNKAKESSKARKIEVFIYVRNAILKRGIEHALSSQNDIEILNLSDVADMLSITHNLTPDVAIVDADLPSEEGLNVMRQIKKHLPGIGIISLAQESSDDLLFRVLKAQADACLNKGVTSEKLVETIHSVARGEHPIHKSLITSPALADQVFRQFQDLSRMNESRAIVIQLTARELEILSHVAEGLMNKQIALRLGISEQTIKNHVTSILRKLNVSARYDAVNVARRQGLIPAAAVVRV